VNHLITASELISDNVEILLKLANTIISDLPERPDFMKKCDEALDRIIEIEPTNSEALFLKGKILHKLEKYEEAIPYLEEAINMEESEDEENLSKANSFFYLGMCHEKMKDFKQSMMCQKRCLTLDNNHFGACIHLANLLANLGEGERAAKYFKHALKIDPDSVNAHFGLGKAI